MYMATIGVKVKPHRAHLPFIASFFCRHIIVALLATYYDYPDTIGYFSFMYVNGFPRDDRKMYCISGNVSL